MIVDSYQDIAGSDTGAVAGGIGWDTLGAKAAGRFDPADAVGGLVEAVLLREVEAREEADCQRCDCEGNGKCASLHGVLHRAFVPSYSLMHISCQSDEKRSADRIDQMRTFERSLVVNQQDLCLVHQLHEL